jgi:CTP:molybdopterin cytidylyltransferase MocA
MHTFSTTAGARQAHRKPIHAAQTRAEKPTIALVLAGGPPHPSFGPGAPRFRPVVPFRGRPIVAYVLDALEASRVGRVLVFHDRGCDLGAAVERGAKSTFIPLQEPLPPLGDTVRFALESAVRLCGIHSVRGSRILILPCDQPFTVSGTIDRVLERANGREFDFAYLGVSRRSLAERYPGRRFRSFLARDLGGRYALQTATLVDGAFLHAADDRVGVRYGDWTREEEDALFANMSALREGRGSVWQVPQFVNEIGVRRLKRNGGRRLMAAKLVRALTGRLRSSDLDELTAVAFRLRTVCIDSDSPELSADIDTPADAAYYQRVVR